MVTLIWWRNLEESSIKISGILLLITSPILATFTKFLANTFRNVRSTFTLKNVCHNFYIFKISFHLLMKKRFSLIPLKRTPKYNSWELKGIDYWAFFIAEYLQRYKLKNKSNFSTIYYFSCFFFCKKAIYENAYKGFNKKVQRTIEIFFIKVNFFIRRNTIFSRMNIIFFNDTRNVILKCFLVWENHLCFFGGRLKSYLLEKEIPSLPKTQKISYFYEFFHKDNFHFPSKE